jgi:hypothetical protein
VEILVTPIITDINKVYGILNIENTTNDNTPIIAESIILPLKNFPNISFVLCVNSKILLAILSENNAHVIFLFIAKKYSLSINRYTEIIIPRTIFHILDAILVAGEFMGLVGMIIGVPVFAIIYSVIKEDVEYKLKNKDLPTETKDYMNKM